MNICNWKNYYKLNWKTPFEGGPKKIFMFGGNTDSSHFDTCLNISRYGEFSSWYEFAKYLQESKNYDDFMTMDGDTEEQMTFKNSKKFFQHLTSSEQMDPVFFVTEDNPLLNWLIKVRRM